MPTLSTTFRPAARWVLACLVLAGVLQPSLVRAEYHYFDDVKSGSDIVMKEVRWPYWNGGFYNTWFDQGWTSVEGVGEYWYNGLGLPAAGSPNPVGGKHVINWSFWGFSNPINITDSISTVYTSPNTFSMPTIGEGTIFRSPGMWGIWQTNVWYRMVLRTWQPANGTPHLGFAGTWMKDSSSGIWYHEATIQLPFSVTGTDGSTGFQEDASGSTAPQRTDYRASYYHYNGAWLSSTNWHAYCHGWQMNAAALTNSVDGTNAAVYLETCNNASYGGAFTNGQSSSEFHLTQPAQPTFDPILVTNYSAAFNGSQLLVQWQVPPTSSPQFAYQINVYTNAGFTGTVVASAYDIAPDARQKLITLPAGITPYAQLTIIDVFNQTNAAIAITPTNASLNAATGFAGAVNGLGYAYYQSATYYTSDSQTNWASMPNFAALTPVSSGAVAGLDLTPRQRRNGYAFNFTGYIYVPASGLYAFTLNSCDGSILYVDGQQVVNFDGKHSPVDLSGWVGLQAGYHTLNVQYFFDTQPTSMFGDYFDALTLSWEGPGITKTVVPVTAFYRVPGGSDPSITLSSPTNGATLSGASVPLSANVTANGNTINKVLFYNGNYFWAQDATAPYSMNSFFWANATNPIRARLVYNTSNYIDSAVNVVAITNVSLAPWQYGQIFYHNQPNGAAIQNGTYSVIGDGVNLLTRQVSGDCTLIAHLAGITSSAAAPDGSTANTGWQAGIILRGTTNMTPGYPWGQSGNAPFAAVFGQVDGGAYYQNEWMVNGGGGYSSGNLGGQKWFKLVRSNLTNFTSYVSANGSTWTLVNVTNMTDFGTALYAGFFTYAGPSSNPNVHWASFDNVSLTGNILGPPTVSVTPPADTSYTGQSTTFTALGGGTAPFYYQWQLNGMNIPGATNATLTLTNLQPTNSGLCSVVLSNANGVVNATATLTVLTPSLATAQIFSNAPLAYLRLNETAGPTAYDSAGNYNGTGEGSTLFGVTGVTNSPFTGFESGNLGAQFNGDASPSDIAITPFNLTTTNFTITGWVNCNGTQDSWSGLAFSRGSGHGVGLMVVNNSGNELRYSWNDNGNDYNAGTGFKMPSGQWSFVALTISPSQAIVYFATNGTLRSWTNNTANIGQTFAGSFYLGCDSNSHLGGSRQFNGTLDEFAFYNRTLTGAQLGQILAASQTAVPGVTLTAPANGANFGAPANLNLSATAVPNGHTVTSVQFYNGATLLGISSNAPYSLTWSNVPVGSYSVLAQVSYDATNSLFSAPSFITVNPLPTTPQNLSAVAIASNQVSLVWSASSTTTGYVVNRDGTPVAMVSGTGWLDTGLAANTTYAYSVTATNAWGSSPPSATSSVTTLSSGNGLAWDADSVTAGPQDGSGTWASGVSNWWNGSAIVAWMDNSIATFGAGLASGNTVTVGNDVTPGGIAFAGLNGSYTLAGGGGGINLAGAPAFNCAVDGAVSAVVKGTGRLLKIGAGTLTLSGVNNYTGGTTISNGALQLVTGSSLPGNITNYGALVINRSDSVTFGNFVGGSGALANLGSGTLTLWGTNTFTGGTTISNGTVILKAPVSVGTGTFSPLGTGPISVSGGTLKVNPDNGNGNTHTFPNAVTLNGGTLYQDDGVTHFSGLLTANAGPNANLIQAHYSGKNLYLDGGMAGSGAVKLTAVNGSYGAGRVYVTANGTYSGTVTVDGSGGLNGGLLVQANNALQNATVDLETTASLDSGNPVGLVLVGGANNVTLAGLTGGSASAYVHNGDATARTLTINNAAACAYAGFLGDGTANGNNFALVKNGGGALTLSGANTYTGKTTVSNGTLLVNGSIGVNSVTVTTTGTLGGSGVIGGAVTVSNGGTLAAGGSAAIGTLTITNALTLSSGSTTALRLAKTGGFRTNDLVTGVTGTLTYAGTLRVTNITSDTNLLAAGDSFQLFNAGAYAANFSGFILPTLATNLGWSTSTLTNNGSIAVGYLPAITNQPQGLKVNPGSPASFSVGATGGGTLSYQWRLNGVSIPGATSTVYSLASAAATNAGNYTAVVANNYGSVTSQVATLVVNLPPLISGINLSPTNGFSLTATGSPGQMCVLLGATNLTPPVAWQSLMTNTADTNGLMNFSDSQSTNYAQRFYRLLTQ
jgi:autotransporter-associated beta strand protein